MGTRSRCLVAALARVSVFGLAVAAAGLLAPGAVKSGSAQSYGYSREDDPLVTGVKKVIGFARDADWDRATAAAHELKPQVAELTRDLGVDLAPDIEATLAARDATRIAYVLTHLVFQALRQKLLSNLREELAKHVTARARLDAVQFYYETILSATVRRADKAQRTEHHRRILELLRELRGTLGSPGLFGVGEKPPDVDRCRDLSLAVERELLAVYPDFTSAAEPARERTDPGAEAADPTSRPQAPAPPPEKSAPGHTP
ncbi:MAG: hypothetical protein AB7O52_03360 [Planctomycetota bacterium]